MGSVTSWRGLEGMLVPLYKIVTMTRFMSRLKLSALIYNQ